MKILKNVRIIEGLVFSFSGHSKGIIHKKNVGRVMVLDLCISPEHALYLYKVS